MTRQDIVLKGAMALKAIRHVSRLTDEKNLGLIAAGVAFYGLLAVFPGLAAVIALWGVIGDPALALTELAEFKALLPQDVYGLIETQLKTLAGTDGLTLGWASVLSLALAIWSSRAGVAALMRGLNAIYDAPNRGGLAHYARALFLTLCLIGVALTALVCVVILPVVLSFIPLGPWANAGITAGRWLVALGVLLLGFSLIYRFGPNSDLRRKGLLSPGAVFATLFWAAASAGFSMYLSNFGNYNEVYGSIGAVIAMLMWLFISAWLVLLGGALNAALSRRFRAAGLAKPTMSE
ncbi:MAG: YihY/virulence factor BrkB family protein [Pseudomonadota bacterium]